MAAYISFMIKLLAADWLVTRTISGPKNVNHLIYIMCIIIIIHKFHHDTSIETKLQGRCVSRITLQL